MRRRQLFHRTGALHSLKSVKSGAGQGFEGTGKVSVLRSWNDPGNAGKTVARLRECAGAVWEASFRCEGGVPAICCGGSYVGEATGVSRGWTGTIGGGMVCSQITATA